MCMEKLVKHRPYDEIENRFSTSVNPLLQRIFLARGIDSEQGCELGLTKLLPPDQLLGLQSALDLLQEALENQLKILVVGDFDADGATSCALTLKVLRDFGHYAVDFLVPDRFKFGYGLTPAIVELAAQSKPDLLLTVDNGIASLEGVKAANQLGMRVLVTDHHLPGEQLPAAAAIVNPNQPECNFESKHLAGVGVIFYLLTALRTRLRESGWFKQSGRKEPNLAKYLDLVALGTVADLVPLDLNNRILVSQGIRRVRQGDMCPGVAALLKISGRDYRHLQASDFGFSVGPRLNAAGRLDDMSIGIRCLLSETSEEAWEYANLLDGLNAERKEIEKNMRQEAWQLIDDHLSINQQVPPIFCLYDASWHQGVIGILAARIKEKFHRPAIVFADADDGQIKGSARSIPGLHMRDLLDVVATHNPDVLEKFGGHAMAAGMTISKAHFERFKSLLENETKLIADAALFQPILWTDGSLLSQELNLQTASMLQSAGPWGQQFPEPLFDGVFGVIDQRLVGGSHLKLTLSLDDSVVEAMLFNVDPAEWPNSSLEFVKLVYRLDINRFRGKETLQLIVEQLTSIKY